MDEFEELESELFDESDYAPASAVIDFDSKGDELESIIVGDYSVTFDAIYRKYSGPKANYQGRTIKSHCVRNEKGKNLLLQHLDEVVNEEIQIDFQKRNIDIDDQKLEPPSKSILLSIPLGFFLIFIGGIGDAGVFLLLGSLVCFVGFFPAVAVLFGALVDPRNEYEEGINREIDIGGGIYRRGRISGIIHGLDVYFALQIEHNEVEITDAWEISPTQKLDIYGIHAIYGSGDDSWATGVYNPQFTPANEYHTTMHGDKPTQIILKNRKGINYGQSKKEIGKACQQAIDYGEEIRENWQGPIVLHSIPQMDIIENAKLSSVKSKQKKLQKVFSKISDEHKNRLKEIYDGVIFLNNM